MLVEGEGGAIMTMALYTIEFTLIITTVRWYGEKQEEEKRG